MESGRKVRVKRGDHKGRRGVVREVSMNHARIAVAWVDFKDGSGMEIALDDLAKIGAAEKAAAKEKGGKK